MIKIIEHGYHTYHRWTCTKCGCKIECSQEDVMYERDITGAPMYVLCPECGERIILTESYIPAGYNTSLSVGTTSKD